MAGNSRQKKSSFSLSQDWAGLPCYVRRHVVQRRRVSHGGGRTCRRVLLFWE
ncbi:hypothetical protein ACS0TY_026003 [Phlomoides rotata]